MKKLQRYEPLTFLIAGILFLVVFWTFGYDGLTFSDDVSYITLGHQFWKGDLLPDQDNFTTRWGAYLFPGLITYLFGFSDRLAAFSSLLYLVLALIITWKAMPANGNKSIAVLFFVSNVYLLHFLTKVYPDSALVLCVSLVPAALLIRHRKPVGAAAVLAITFFIGFCTKETIIFLFPLPFLLLVVDSRRKNRLLFYGYFFSFSAMITLGYLTYSYWQFGNPFFRLQNIEASHYISEYSFYDKPWPFMAERLSIGPFLTFIERSYWIWIVLAIPCIVRSFKRFKEHHLIYSLSALCLLIGFWFMSTSLSFYNPIHLNPRHLIILLPVLSGCIALEAKRWVDHYFWNRFTTLWIGFGGFVSIAILEWQIGIFYLIFALTLAFAPSKWRIAAIIPILAIAVIMSVSHQRKLKNYRHFKAAFLEQLEKSSYQTPLVSHDFVARSSSLLAGNDGQNPPVLSLNRFLEIQSPSDLPAEFTLFIYSYYQHAYPEDEKKIMEMEAFLQKHDYIQIDSFSDQWLRIAHYQRIQSPTDFPKDKYAALTLIGSK